MAGGGGKLASGPLASLVSWRMPLVVPTQGRKG
jgi:hypothetical protein